MARRRPPDPPPLEIRRFSPEEAQWAVGLLESRIANVTALDPKAIPYSDARVRSLEERIRGNVLEIFRENSREYREHRGHEISGRGRRPVATMVSLRGGPPPGLIDAERQQDFAAGIPRTVTMLQSLIETVKERTDAARLVAGKVTEIGARTQSVEVFIVHGHAEGPRESVARFVERLGLRPIILHEQASEGRTIIEKIERHSEVGYTVVLLTGDDRGGLREAAPASYQPRARQNVVLELGYFLGRLGRRHVCVLHEPGVEIPSDYDGVVYVPLDPAGAWRFLLAREMKAAGFEDIDLNHAG
jgi:predicted nucleotide-binding protein